MGHEHPNYKRLHDTIVSSPDEHEGLVYLAKRFVMANGWITLYDSDESAREVYEDAVEYFTDPAHLVA
ncbi:MAG: hypothetical protein EBS05_11635 [Proteobacteria bacterium]|nr:hypothetical protein [Pseudomonadota bacterium]NDD36801.1 hypothetical protein [Verrucomicrobiota bacterium]